MWTMLGHLLIQYAEHKMCTPQSFTERLLFNPASTPFCSALNKVESVWTNKTWKQLIDFVLMRLE
jgi:hypothetical protein